MLNKIIKFFKSCNFKEVFVIALPLVLSNAGHAVNLFVDRAMLTHYSSAAMAAAFPAGLSVFAFSCLFVGTVGYSGAFVAQYFGARENHHIGAAVWQGVWMAVIGGVVMWLSGFFAEDIFRFYGHEKHIQPLEVAYYKILAAGTAANLLSIAMGNFWSGRGKVIMVMTVNFIIAGANIFFNYLLIFGVNWDLPLVGHIVIPEYGIRGAAYGTVAGSAIGVLIYLAAFFLPANIREYKVLNFWDWALFKKLVRYGFPTGIQLAIDLVGFQIFIVLQGKIDSVALAAAGIAFGLNSLAFTPILGVGHTVGILVGQSIGSGDIPHAEISVRSARLLSWVYMLVLGVVFCFYPDPLLTAFRGAEKEIMDEARIMLRFCAGYLLFDALFIIYGSAIKSAGDTRFAMIIHGILAAFAYVLPCILMFLAYSMPWFREYFGAGARSWCLYGMWTISVVYVIICGIVFYWRYKQGRWKSMSLINE